MTRFLERALAEAEKLPDLEQDAIAALILEQIAADHAWDEAFPARRTNSLGSRRRCARTSPRGASGPSIGACHCDQRPLVPG